MAKWTIMGRRMLARDGLPMLELVGWGEYRGTSQEVHDIRERIVALLNAAEPGGALDQCKEFFEAQGAVPGQRRYGVDLHLDAILPLISPRPTSSVE